MSRNFNSKFSPVASATTLYSLPLAPSSVSVSRINASGYLLSWIDNAFNETLFSVETGVSGTTNYVETTTLSPNLTLFIGNYSISQDSWSTRYTGQFRDVYSSNLGNIVYLASNTGILRSLDYGVTWTRPQIGNFNQIKCSSDGAIVVAQSGYLSGCVYNQTGTNFLRAFNSTGSYDISSGGNVIYRTVGNLLQISSDQGVNFTSTGIVPFNDNLSACACSDDGSIVGVSKLNGQSNFFSNSGGANYGPISSISNKPFNKMKFNSDATLFGFVATGNNSLYEWSTSFDMTGIFSNKIWRDLYFADDNSIIAGVETNGSLWVSNNTGTNPTEVFSSKNWLSVVGSSGGIYIYAISSGEAGVGTDGKLYRNNPTSFAFRMRSYNPRGYSSYSNTGYM